MLEQQLQEQQDLVAVQRSDCAMLQSATEQLKKEAEQ